MKRMIAFILAIMMLASLLPVSVLAEELDEPNELEAAELAVEEEPIAEAEPAASSEMDIDIEEEPDEEPAVEEEPIIEEEPTDEEDAISSPERGGVAGEAGDGGVIPTDEPAEEEPAVEEEPIIEEEPTDEEDAISSPERGGVAGEAGDGGVTPADEPAAAENTEDEQAEQELVGEIEELTEDGVEAAEAVKTAISKQPSNVTAAVGSTATFRVKATGANLKYQWQWNDKGTWKTCGSAGNTTATLKVSATAGRNGIQYRCRVTGANGTAYSNAATLKISTKITSQPSNVTTETGKTAIFRVKATGANLKYQWQWNDKGTWKTCGSAGNTTATLKVSATAGRNGIQYRCRVTGINGTVYSKAATLKISTKITSQPSNVTTAVGSTAVFRVKATGVNLKYQWQWNDRGTWKTCGSTGNATATLKVAATAGRNGIQYRCRVTGANGTVYSSAATLKISTKITSQPSNVTTAVGSTAVFRVKATGVNLKYQWQWNDKGTWKTCGSTGNKTATLKVSATAGRNGVQYRCRVTGANGTVYSSAATLRVQGQNVLLVTDIPAPNEIVCSGKVGDNVSYTLSRNGVLTITGSGSTYNYLDYINEPPHWGDYRNSIKYVVISGISIIGNGLFADCSNLQIVNITGGVTQINSYAFSRCSRLRTVVLPASLETIQRSVFDDCTSIQDVYYGGSRTDWNKVAIKTSNDDLFRGRIHVSSDGRKYTAGETMSWTPFRYVAGKKMRNSYVIGSDSITIYADGTFSLEGGKSGRGIQSNTSGQGKFINAQKIDDGVYRMEMSAVTGKTTGKYREANPDDPLIPFEEDLSYMNGDIYYLIFSGAATPARMKAYSYAERGRNATLWQYDTSTTFKLD